MDKEAPCQTRGNLTGLFINKCTEVPCLAIGNLRTYSEGNIGKYRSLGIRQISLQGKPVRCCGKLMESCGFIRSSTAIPLEMWQI